MKEEIEVCPNCGSLVDYLNDDTGWCNPCSGITSPHRCERCNHITEDKYCSGCKYIIWLETNADAIENVMAIYLVPASIAKEIVRKENRPICLSCAKPIKGGTRNRHFFCRQTAACRKAHNAYHYYRRVRRLPQREALRHAIEAATIKRLTDNISN